MYEVHRLDEFERTTVEDVRKRTGWGLDVHGTCFMHVQETPGETWATYVAQYGGIWLAEIECWNGEHAGSGLGQGVGDTPEDALRDATEDMRKWI